jgi:late competence protein required for DNA uptake (superfamily II DNA/RNA helicase)
MGNKKTCPRCGGETEDAQKCNTCGTKFCWKCLQVPTINPGEDVREFKSYCPECKSIDIARYL